MSPSLFTTLTHFFPGKPTFTDQNVPDLAGKVYFVSGANTGIGREVARILYSKHARVYVAARSEQKARAAIAHIEKATPQSKGKLFFIHLDLNDLNNVKAAANAFLQSKQSLHGLFNNAGVMVSAEEPPPRTAQGHELSVGVNCIATLLLTKLLTPALVSTAKIQPANTVRVIWLSSYGMELSAHEGVGFSTENADFHTPVVHTERYGLSKSGAWALGVEFGRRHEADGIVSVQINPGNVSSDLAREQSAVLKVIASLVCYPVINGAYTELYAAFSPQITIESFQGSGQWGKYRLL